MLTYSTERLKIAMKWKGIQMLNSGEFLGESLFPIPMKSWGLGNLNPLGSFQKGSLCCRAGKNKNRIDRKIFFLKGKGKVKLERGAEPTLVLE